MNIVCVHYKSHNRLYSAVINCTCAEMRHGRDTCCRSGLKNTLVKTCGGVYFSSISSRLAKFSRLVLLYCVFVLPARATVFDWLPDVFRAREMTTASFPAHTQSCLARAEASAQTSATDISVVSARNGTVRVVYIWNVKAASSTIRDLLPSIGPKLNFSLFRPGAYSTTFSCGRNAFFLDDHSHHAELVQYHRMIRYMLCDGEVYQIMHPRIRCCRFPAPSS